MRGRIFPIWWAMALLAQPASSGWEWQSPYPGASSLHGVFVAGRSCAFAVGVEPDSENPSLVLRYDGIHWERLSLPLQIANWRSVWGTSSDNVYLVGSGGRCIHWDGSSWTQLDTGTNLWFEDVWGIDEDHIYAAAEGQVLRFDGEEWIELDPPTDGWLHSVWAASPGSVFTVGYNGRIEGQGGNGIILHWDGIPDLGVHLDLPGTVHPGDEFQVTGYLTNAGYPRESVPVFFVLEA